MKFGGCAAAMGGEFTCGDQSCDNVDTYCEITMNDIAGPNEPEYVASCEAFADACVAQDCSCFEDPLGFDGCFEGGGLLIHILSGG